MTSRERLHHALEHKEADMVPVGFGGMRSTGISAVAYAELRRYLGLPEIPIKVYDVIQQLAEPDTDTLERLKADVVQLHRLKTTAGIPNDDWRIGELYNGTPCLFPKDYSPKTNEKGRKELWLNGDVYAKMPEAGFYFDRVSHPYQDVASPGDIDKIPAELISDYELEYLRTNAKRSFETTQYGILGAFGGGIFEVGQGDFGYENYFCKIMIQPKLMHYYNERLCSAHLHNLKKYLEAVGDYIDVIQFGDDLGMQNTLQISAELYREMIKPYQTELYQYVKKNYPHVKVFLHSCGAIFPLLPDLIEAGVEVLNPVQLSAAGMEPKLLKGEFGDDLTFWGGGVSTQTTLMSGTLSDIKESVRKNMQIFSEGGGFVFTQDHNIQSGISPERIMAVYDTANDCC